MSRSAGRRALAAGILAVWAGLVALHVRREYFKPLATRLAEGSRALAPGSQFYVVRMNGRPIGMATSRLDTVPEGFAFEDVLTVDVPALDTFHSAVARTRLQLGRALQLRNFDFELRSEVGEFSVRGETRGDSVLELEVGAGGGAQHSRIRMEEGFSLATALPLRLAAAGQLRVGGEYSARLFDPSVLATRDVTVRVTGRDTLIVADSAEYDTLRAQWHAVAYDTVPAWRIEESYGGIAVESWLDEDGRVVRASSPLGFVLEREPFEIARADWLAGRADRAFAQGYGGIIEGTAIASNVDLDALEQVNRLAVRLLDVDLVGFDLEGGRQRLHGDTLFIEREAPGALAPAYRLPYRGRGEPMQELEATPLIQAADPQIARVARRAGGGTDDPLVAAQRLHEWVYRFLEKDIALSIPSAIQVLEAGKGDCNEHTVLYVALARALGLPARTAVGLVHVRGRFYYHAWPEVWLGRWVAVDPTLGQFPADASHLRFLVGGLARQIELIRIIGRLRLEVVV
ncbi:MAG: transglutaminase domain-containing protein [Gemmatimonadetes bacterium]|nr:transglutaminase domain-containing protein [Gemmatimonadota bacterium]